MNRDVANLPELLEEKVGSATSYACGYWAMHVRSSPTMYDYANLLIPSVTEFFGKNAIPWIEVMSLDNRLESVIHSIYNLLDWLGAVCTFNYYSQAECLNHSSFDTGSCPYLTLTRLSRRLPPIHDAFLPPHTTIRVTHIPFRLTSFAGVFHLSLHGPWENHNHRVLRTTQRLGNGSADHHSRFQRFHLHDNFWSQDCCCLR